MKSKPKKLNYNIPVWKQIDRNLPTILQKPQVEFFPEVYDPYSGVPWLKWEQAISLAKYLEFYWRFDEKNASVPDYIDFFQYDAVIEMLALVLQGKNSQLLAGTGTGKTYMMFYLMDIISYYNYFEQLIMKEGRFYPFLSCMFVPASVVEQSNEVKKDFPNCKAKVVVTNYETLRTKSGLGNIFIGWETISKQGVIDEYPFWREELAPAFMLFDENQKLKNPGSMQTKLCAEYLQLKHSRIVRTVCASATPFVRPIESRFVCLSLEPMYQIKEEYLKLKKDKWTSERKEIINEDLHKKWETEEIFKTVDVTNIPRVHSNNFQDWIKDEVCGSRIRPEEYSPTAMERLTDFLAIEHQLVHVHNVKFKHKTFNKHILIDFFDEDEKKQYWKAYQDYIDALLKLDKNVPGGMGAIFAEITKFRKASEVIRAKHLARIALEQMQAGKNVIVATAYKETQEKVLDILLNEYKIHPDLIALVKGGQSKKARWDNINRFQDEKAQIMLLMQQAGGVGLSLHNFKARNKRPRFVLMPPVWSIIEMLQILGRAHRINSSSTTVQWVIWYRGTIEENVYVRLQEKSLSMRELMRKKEQWSDLFVEESKRKHVSLENVYEEGSSALIDEIINEEESEETERSVFNLDEESVANNMADSEDEITADDEILASFGKN